jgi:hypothetical protein
MVQPVAIFYPHPNPETRQIEINPKILFYGGITAQQSFDKIARSRRIAVQVHFLRPIDGKGKTRDEIARHAYEEVVTAVARIKTAKH